MAKKILNETLAYLVAALVVFADQYVKYLVRTELPLQETWNPLPWLAPYARIMHIQNTGAAFGMFQDAGLLFAVIAVIVSMVIVYYVIRLPAGHGWLRLTLGLMLGGALGNLIDRLLFNFTVTDMISVTVPFVNYNFAVFNVADASISVGVVLLVILMWVEGRAARKNSAVVPPAAPAGETSPM